MYELKLWSFASVFQKIWQLLSLKARDYILASSPIRSNEIVCTIASSEYWRMKTFIYATFQLTSFHNYRQCKSGSPLLHPKRLQATQNLFHICPRGLHRFGLWNILPASNKYILFTSIFCSNVDTPCDKQHVVRLAEGVELSSFQSSFMRKRRPV